VICGGKHLINKIIENKMITQEFRQQVAVAIIKQRDNFTSSDAMYAKSIGLDKSIFSRLKKGETEKIAHDSFWIQQGRELGISNNTNNWKAAKTVVYTEIESSLKFCQNYSKSMILVDDCGIGKTFCTKHIAKQLTNAFYIDCSQAATRIAFVKLLAKTIGLDMSGKFIDIKNNIKYYLAMLPNPIIILDEAGDLDYSTFMTLKELWNGTDGQCAWFMMGADGLKAKMEKGINNHKVGYREMFSRFSDSYLKLVPREQQERVAFYTDLIGDVAGANGASTVEINKFVKMCIAQNQKSAGTDNKSLRYLHTLIQLNNN